MKRLKVKINLTSGKTLKFSSGFLTEEQADKYTSDLLTLVKERDSITIVRAMFDKFIVVGGRKVESVEITEKGLFF